MTMRLSLIIDGQSKEAVVAVDKTVASLGALDSKAKATAASVNTAIKAAGKDVAATAALTEQGLKNMQYQFQDIAVGLSSGQSPFTVMTQQGSQLAQAFKSGTGPIEAIKALGVGLATFLTNPLNLSVVAIGLAASAVQFFFGLIKSSAKDTEKDLETHADLIKKIGDNYDTATGRAKNYAAYTVSMLAYFAKRDAEALRGDLKSSISTALSSTNLGIGAAGRSYGQSSQALKAAGPELESVVQLFLNSVRAGKPDVQSFADQVAKVSQNAEKNSALRVMADQILATIDPALQLRGKLEQAEDAAKGLTGNTHLLNNALGVGTDKVQKFTSAIKAIDIPQFNRDRQGVDYERSDRFARKSILDIIGASEGTDQGRGYNETLGYGKFTGGNVELITKNLNEILALQAKMLADPTNTFHSSALGRYQITSETIKDFMPKLGLTGLTIFSPAIQDKIALGIINELKGDKSKADGRWPSLKGVAPADFRAGLAADGSARSSVAQDISDVAAKKVEELAKAKEKAADIGSKWQAILRGEDGQLTGQLSVLGKSASAIAANRKEQELLNRAHALFGEHLSAQVIAQIKAEADAYGVAAGKVEDFKKKQEEQGVVAALVLKKQQQDLADYIQRLDERRALVRGFVSDFTSAELSGKSFFDSLKSSADNLLQSFIKLSENRFLDMLLGKQGTASTGILGQLVGSLFGGGTGASLHATGAAFAGGSQVSAFANGDVVTSPRYFPMAGGKTGLMGEAGPEAIMPLSRGFRVGVATARGETSLPLTRLSSGKLGVKAFADGGVVSGGGGLMGDAGSGSGGGIYLNIKNYSGEKATAKATRNRDGSVNIEAKIGEAINRHIGQGGADKVLHGRFTGLGRRTETYG